MIRQSKNEGALWKRFRGMTESIGPMCRHILLPQLLSRFPVGRVPGYRTCRKEHALPIVRDEFRPAIPRRVARQRCPSPLHRHHQLKTIAASNGMIYHRTAPSLLTGCLTPGDKRSASRVRSYSTGRKFSTVSPDSPKSEFHIKRWRGIGVNIGSSSSDAARLFNAGGINRRGRKGSTKRRIGSSV